MSEGDAKSIQGGGGGTKTVTPSIFGSCDRFGYFLLHFAERVA